MALSASSFMVCRAPAGRRGVVPAPVSHPKTHLLPGNQRLLRSSGAAKGVIQPKLRLSQESDAAERQAEAVAEQIVSEGDAIDTVPVQIHRMCPECEEELARQEEKKVEEPELEEAVAEEEDEDYEYDETGMPKRDSSGETSVSESVIPHGPGTALPGEVRSPMENAFGASFDQVRIHTDQESARAASRIGALAFTVGSNIYFGPGRYQPSVDSGRKLLAHELTHVVQQHGSTRELSRQKKKARCGNVCSAGNCPQGKQAKVTNDDCAENGPSDEKNFITHLEVSISKRTVVATWSNGKPNTWPCSPRPGKDGTPTGPDKVGVKCTINHTNVKHKAGMAWFTGFRSQFKTIGFHDSQPVGPGCVSLGCVRVCCDVARIINQNTWSGKTTINVS